MSTVSEKAIRKLLVDVQLFDNMTNAQKAAFRARVSRYLSVVGDDGNDQYDATYADILTAVQDKVGKSAKRTAQKLTAQDIIDEFSQGIDYSDSRKLAAFRAKVTRLINRTKDETAVTQLNDILSQIDDQLKAINRKGILNLAKRAGLLGGEDSKK